MILRNHGLLTVERTVAAAFLYIYRLERACQVQVDAMAYRQNLVPPPSWSSGGRRSKWRHSASMPPT